MLNSSEWEARTDTVRVGSLRGGQKFMAVDGKIYRFEREHCGAHVVTDEHGETNWFAGCADVVPL